MVRTSIKTGNPTLCKECCVRSDRNFYRSCQELLVRIAGKFYDTHVVFNIKGADSFNNMISDLRSNNSLKRTPSAPLN